MLLVIKMYILRVLELTGDTSFDASLQTVAKASIILTTVR